MAKRVSTYPKTYTDDGKKHMERCLQSPKKFK